MKHKQLIEDIIEVNGLTREELQKIARTKKKSNSRKTNSNEIFIFKLVQNGVKIPYYYRPECIHCKVRFIPDKFRQETCAECRSARSVHICLTPEDCIELGMSWEEANVFLHLPGRFEKEYESAVSTELLQDDIL